MYPIRSRTWLPLIAAILVALPGAALAETPRALRWADLMPPLTAGEAVKPKKRMFDVLTGKALPTNPLLGTGQPGHVAQPLAPDAKWMSLKRQQPGAGQPARIVDALDGQRVALGGYIVPLDFDATRITDFLLVPFLGACIHVPPPPANQIVYVKLAKGFDVSDLMVPVTVTGTMRTSSESTGLADAAYTLDADTVEVRYE